MNDPPRLHFPFEDQIGLSEWRTEAQECTASSLHALACDIRKHPEIAKNAHLFWEQHEPTKNITNTMQFLLFLLLSLLVLFFSCQSNTFHLPSDFFAVIEKDICDCPQGTIFEKPEIIVGFGVLCFLTWIYLLTLQDTGLVGVYVRPVHGAFDHDEEQEKQQIGPSQSLNAAFLASVIGFFFPLITFVTCCVCVVSAIEAAGFCQFFIKHTLVPLLKFEVVEHLLTDLALLLLRMIPWFASNKSYHLAGTIALALFVTKGAVSFVCRHHVLGGTLAAAFAGFWYYNELISTQISLGEALVILVVVAHLSEATIEALAHCQRRRVVIDADPEEYWEDD